MSNSCGSGETIYYSDLGHKRDQSIQRIRSIMNCILPVKTSHKQNNENLELIVLVCSNQCFITHNTQWGTWTASHPLWGMEFDLCYFPAMGVGDPIARDPSPCQPKIKALITLEAALITSPQAAKGVQVSPHRHQGQPAHVLQWQPGTHSQTPPPWPSRTGKHLWQVCPHGVQCGWWQFWL